MYKSFLSLITFLVVMLSSHSQSLSSPEAVLGYPLGTQYSRHHQVVDYFKTLASEATAWMRVEPYGRTNEGRELVLAFLSSPDNMQQLEAIRLNHLRKTGLLAGEATTNDIAVVWLSFNVHGNEASCSEAAMQTAYKLLTEKQDLLDNTVVIIDPNINPDGRDRYVNWYNGAKSTPYNSDPQSSEHNEPWPGGRSNHYLFDLNRDWAWATQVETQQRLKIYNRWMPHVHADYHEQGYNSPYYFAPAAEPFHEIITDWQREFQAAIGKNNAAYFDAQGWLYFTRESFDLLYPSYGDTYPTYMGAIGMTYEQAGHSRSGLGVVTDEGEELTLLDRLTHHTVTALSTIEVSSKNARKLNAEFVKFFENSDLTYKSYALSGDPDKIARLQQLLDRHDIRYERAEGNKASGYLYSSKSQGSMSLDEHSMVVHSNQPKGKMVKVLFEPEAELTDSLTYDITAWSLPYAYGLEAVASTSRLGSSAAEKTAKVLPELTDAYGYVSKWTSMKDAQFLSALAQAGFKVRFTEKPFQSGGQQFEAGSLIILKRDQKHLSDYATALNDLAQQYDQTLSRITTGLSTMAPDMGSSAVKLMEVPKVALLCGEGTSSLGVGSVWHFFEKELTYPLTLINTANLNRTNLEDYKVLIMPEGYYRSSIGPGEKTKIDNWISEGGTLIAIGSALRNFVGKEGLSLAYKDTDSNTDDDLLLPYAQRERAYANSMITGAIFKVMLDTTHPLAFGYTDHYFTLKLGSSTFDLMDGGYNVGYLQNNEVYSGFAGQEALANLGGTLVFGEERKGSGSLVYMVDNPLFRNFWDNGKLFLVNAVFFVNN